MMNGASTWQGTCIPPSQPPWEICGPGWEEGSPPCPGGAQSLVFCALHRLQNETAAHEVLESIQSYFESQPFDFRGAQIISGQEEGVYGWITANYIMGNFLEVCGRNAWFLSSQCIPSLRVTAEVEGLAQGAFLPCTSLGEHRGQQLRKGSHLLDHARNRIALLFQKKLGRDLNLTLGSFRRAA